MVVHPSPGDGKVWGGMVPKAIKKDSKTGHHK